MTPKARLLVGMATTVMLLFLGLGFLFETTSIAERKSVYAGIFLALGAFRGLMWVRELRWYLTPEDDDDLE